MKAARLVILGFALVAGGGAPYLPGSIALSAGEPSGTTTSETTSASALPPAVRPTAAYGNAAA